MLKRPLNDPPSWRWLADNRPEEGKKEEEEQTELARVF